MERLSGVATLDSRSAVELSDADGAEGAAGKTGGMFAPAAFASADGSENPNAEVCVGSAGTTEGAPTAGASGAGKPGAAVAESVSWSRSLLFCGLEGNFFFLSGYCLLLLLGRPVKGRTFFATPDRPERPPMMLPNTEGACESAWFAPVDAFVAPVVALRALIGCCSAVLFN